MKVYLKPFEIFDVHGKWFLLRLKSMMHDEISDCDVKVLREFVGITEIDASEEQFALLKRYRLIGDKEWDESAELERLNALYADYFRRDELNVMELFVAQSCNMGCIYCYGSDGSYHQQGMMTVDIARKAIDMLRSRCRDLKKASIVFFGGEPMMNFPVIHASIEYAEQVFGEGIVAYGMATNMSLMTDEQLDYFAKLPKFELLVSIDGPRDIQNRQRPLLNGKDSYEVCAERIRAAISRGIHCSGRATVYADADRNAIIAEMKKLGLTTWQLTAVSGCASDGVRRDDAARLYKNWLHEMPMRTNEFIQAIKSRNKNAADAIMADDDMRRLIIEGANGAVFHRDIVGCSAGSSHIAVSAIGDLYPCHRFVGMDEFRIGDLDSKAGGWQEFEKGRLACCADCAGCMLRFGCSGACYYQCYTDGPRPSIYAMPEYFCEYTRMRARLSIYISHMLNSEDKRWYLTREYVR